MLKKAEIKIICASCKHENSTDSQKCSQCNADLLPARTIGIRIVGFVAGCAGIGLTILLWNLSETGILESSGTLNKQILPPELKNHWIDIGDELFVKLLEGKAI